MSKNKCACNVKHEGTCENPRIKRVIERDMPILNYDLVEGNIKHLQGQVLTLLEAIIADKTQLKSAKDIVKDFCNSKLTHLFDMYGGPAPEMPNYSPVGDGVGLDSKE